MKSSITICLAVLAIGINSQTLKASVIQSASTVSGQTAGQEVAGQAKSDTSTENFINICDGKTLTNGKQNEAGSCNGIPMGDIPSKKNMVSSIILFPKTGEAVKAGQTFNVSLKVANMVTGFATNPQNSYYAAPQKLEGGKIVGHVHVTVQDMGNTMNPSAPLAADKFAFFTSIKSKADQNGEASATVTDGLPAGKYRVCTIASAANHQAVIMPVAQRGSADDCTKFEVTATGGGGNNTDKNADKNGDKKGDKKGAGANNAAGENKKKDDDKSKKADDKKDANAAKPPAKANNKRKIEGENNAESNDAEDCGGNGNSDKPKAVDENSKKSSSSDMEMTKELAKAADEGCKTIAKRTTRRHIENTANLEGNNEIKKDKRNQKRSNRVFIS